MTESKSTIHILNQAIDQASTEFEALAAVFDICSADKMPQGNDGCEDATQLVIARLEDLKDTTQNDSMILDAAQALDHLEHSVSLCDAKGKVIWSNSMFDVLPELAQRKVCSTCLGIAKGAGQPVSRKLTFQTHDQDCYEMIASLVGVKNDQGSDRRRVVAIVWDNSREHLLQKKLDAIDLAGSELVKIESDTVATLNTAERLALLEDKIIHYTRDLLHFDHFGVYIIDEKTNRLLSVMNVGMPREVANYELYASTTGSGISGYVVATGKSYICADVNADTRYLPGLEHAASSLSTPLCLHDKIVGVFNVESETLGAFSEDDRQFAEIFGRYIALALNILDLLVVERCTTSGTVAVNLIGEISTPLNDLAVEAERLREVCITNPDTIEHIDQMLKLIEATRDRVRDVAQGPKSILGVQEALEQTDIDPLFVDCHVLIADDEANIRDSIKTVLTRKGCQVTLCETGAEAIEILKGAAPDEFGLILSDISMPDRNGYEVFAAAHKINPEIPVILMTGFGYDPHHSIVRASQEGLQCVLFKPFQINQLLHEVCQALTDNSDESADN